MDPSIERQLLITRRQALGRSASGLGTAALGTAALAGSLATEANAASSSISSGGILQRPHHRPTAKRVIYLFMSGAPSQIDMWDHKPEMEKHYDKDLPESIRRGQRITTMTSGQSRFPIAPSVYKFARHGESGTSISELLPHTASIVDKLAVVRSVYTEAINHDPAITFIQTGHQQPGRPSLGAWLNYGLGSPNQDLPGFVVLTSSWTGRKDAQALYSRLWGSGFLPSAHQGVALRSKGDPVLYLSNPKGIDRKMRRRMLDGLAELNQHQFEQNGDPEIQSRIKQYELGYRMQSSVPDLVDFKDEPEHILDMYGPDVRKPGTFAASCLMARRMAERGVPLTQIFIRGWDQHFNVTGHLPKQCRDIDQPCAALIMDLEQRGMLDDTLVVWGGEFGRTIYCQGKLSRKNYGRDHHPRCFTMWMAGGGIKGGLSYGKTDDFSYNIDENPVHIHDINTTILHCLGIDHERLTYRFQGRDYRLTDVHGKVVTALLA